MSAEDEIRKLIEEARDADSAPDFGSVWSRARARVGAGREGGGAWRWALGPAFALASAAAVALVTTALDTEDGATGGGAAIAARADAGRAGALLADLVAPEIPDGATDGVLGIDDDAERSPFDFAGLGAELETAMELAYGEAGSTAFPIEVGTDFLLTMEIPAWDGSGEGERNLL